MIMIGSTVAAFVMDDEDTWGAWLYNAEEVVDTAAEVGENVHYFVAIETDARGIVPFMSLLDRLSEIHGEYWSFSLDDMRDEVTTENRLRHITTGQNIVSTVATERLETSHLLFCAADTEPPADVIPKLLETGHPYIGPRIDTYGAICRGPKMYGFPDEHGRPVEFDPSWEIEDAMPSAACMMLERRVFTRLRWRVEAPHTDDPAYQLDARELLGIRSAVRTDIKAQHYPEAIGAVETRGHDMTVHR